MLSSVNTGGEIRGSIMCEPVLSMLIAEKMSLIRIIKQCVVPRDFQTSRVQ